MDLHLPYLTFAYLHISLYTASLVCVSPPTFIVNKHSDKADSSTYSSTREFQVAWLRLGRIRDWLRNAVVLKRIIKYSEFMDVRRTDSVVSGLLRASISTSADYCQSFIYLWHITRKFNHCYADTLWFINRPFVGLQHSVGLYAKHEDDTRVCQKRLFWLTAIKNLWPKKNCCLTLVTELVEPNLLQKIVYSLICSNVFFGSTDCLIRYA